MSLCTFLNGHDCLSLSFSLDGRFLASGSGSPQNTLSIYSIIEDFKCIHTGYHKNGISSVAFSSDGKYLASGSFDKLVKVWNTTNLKDNPKILDKHSNAVSSVAFSPDGNHLASGSWDTNIVLWKLDSNTGTWNYTNIVTHNHSTIRTVAFSCDGLYLASGGDDDLIRVWSTLDFGECKHVLSGHDSQIKSISFSQDGKHLASGSTDFSIRIWLVTDWKCVTTLNNHNDFVNSIDFSYDGKYLVSASNRDFHSTVILWSTASWTAIRRFGRYDSASCVAFNPNSKQIAVGCNCYSRDYTRSIDIWTACNWTDRNNSYFSKNIQSVVFYITCMFEQCYIELPMEMLLEVLEFSSMIMSLK